MEHKVNLKQIIGLFVSLVVVGMIASWFLFFKKKEVSLANFVPTETFLVGRVEKPQSFLDSLFTSRLLQRWQKTPFVRVNTARRQSLSTLLKSQLAWFNEKNVLFSAHVLSKEKLGVLFYLPLQPQDREAINTITKRLNADKQLAVINRLYKKIRIVDIKHRQTGEQFSFFIQDDYWVGSFAPILVEEAIQMYKEGEENTFAYSSFQSLSKPNNLLHFYFNFNQIERLYTYLLDLPAKQQVAQHTAKMLGKAQLDFYLVENKLILNGRLEHHFWEVPWTSIWYKQEAQPFLLRDYLPNNTALFHRMSVSDPSLFFQNLKYYWIANYSAIIPRRQALAQQYDITWKALEKHCDREVVEVLLEEEVENPHKILILKVDNAPQTAALLKNWAEQVAKIKRERLFTETYQRYRIFELGITDFPQLLLGQNFTGYKKSFVTQVARDVLVLSSDYKALRIYLDKIANEEVWAKSVRLTTLLDDIPEKQNWTTFVQPVKAWRWLQYQAAPYWQRILSRYEFLFKQVDYYAFQVNNGRNGRVWMNVSAKSKKTDTTTQSNTQKAQQLTRLSEKAITQPFVVINHNTQKKELLLQDANNALKLITLAGKQLWSVALEGPIVSDVYQIDYYKNNKLQYLLATEHTLYLIDRLGRKVANFPKRFREEIKLNALNVFDYDNDKQYRYWLTNEAGEVFLTNKKGEKPKGWQLNKLTYRANWPAQWVRVQGKDHLILVQENGIVHCYNRRGEVMKGFPVDLDTKIDGDFLIQKGVNKAKTFLHTVSTNGEVIQISLTGKVKRKQLLKPSDNTTFRLVKSTDANTAIIVRQTLSKVAFLSLEGQTLFETKFSTASPMAVQYFYYGTTNWFVAVTDKEAGFTYVFDTKGWLVEEPLQSTQPIHLTYDDTKSEIHIYKVNGKTLSKTIMKR